MVNLEDESGVEGFTAELPAAVQASLGQKDYTDVSSASVRRADSDKAGDQYRLYEVAGMPHGPGGAGCEGPASTFPVAAVTRGTFNLLNRWVETGQKPPRAPRLKMAQIAKVSKVAVDQNGNATGGVRSPYLDDALVRYDPHAPGVDHLRTRGSRSAPRQRGAGEEVQERRHLHEAVHQGSRRDDQGRIHRRRSTEPSSSPTRRQKATQVLGQ